MHYRVNLRDLPNGSVEATCPDIPAFFTVQPSRPEALDFVRENLASALQTYRKKHEPIPVTSDRSATCLVYLPVRVQAKIILWNYMLKNRWRLSDLARLLGVTQTQAQIWIGISPAWKRLKTLSGPSEALSHFLKKIPELVKRLRESRSQPILRTAIPR